MNNCCRYHVQSWFVDSSLFPTLVVMGVIILPCYFSALIGWKKEGLHTPFFIFLHLTLFLPLLSWSVCQFEWLTVKLLWEPMLIFFSENDKVRTKLANATHHSFYVGFSSDRQSCIFHLHSCASWTVSIVQRESMNGLDEEQRESCKGERREKF